MPLKLMYITNRPDVAKIAEENGVDRIFVDMEYIGKAERQGKMDTVQNHHTIEDVRKVRAVLNKAELLVYFRTIEEIHRFITAVSGRVKTMLLLETKEAVAITDVILTMKGIDEIHIGLNDLCISYGKTFMFELLTDGTVERLCRKMELAGKFYGFGGIASLGRGMVPAEMIIKEHYRLGSHMAILSRSFCNINNFEELDAVEEIFYRGVREIRTLEKECGEHLKYFSDNRKELTEAVDGVVEIIKQKKAM